jgi:hypothetical protein
LSRFNDSQSDFFVFILYDCQYEDHGGLRHTKTTSS